MPPQVSNGTGRIISELVEPLGWVTSYTVIRSTSILLVTFSRHSPVPEATVPVSCNRTATVRLTPIRFSLEPSRTGTLWQLPRYCFILHMHSGATSLPISVSVRLFLFLEVWLTQPLCDCPPCEVAQSTEDEWWRRWLMLIHVCLMKVEYEDYVPDQFTDPSILRDSHSTDVHFLTA